jgi:hypothetical protein
LTVGTSVTTPLVIGGTSTTSTLSLRSTSGIGAAGADIIFQVGNNGATEAARILNSGFVGIGNASPQATLHVGAGADAPSFTANLYVSAAGATSSILRDSTNNVEMFTYVDSAGAVLGSSTNHTLFLRTNGVNTNQVTLLTTGLLGLMGVSPTMNIGIKGNAAGTIGVERHPTANTAGNSLTLKSGGATSGATDKAAGALILTTGLGTGNSTPAQIQLMGDNVLATGTTDHTTLVRYVPNMYKVLTDGSATTCLSITVASGTANGGILDYLIEVVDGSANTQVEVGRVYFHANNQGGSVTATATETSSQQTLGSGTLSTTWAISAANPAVLSVNADTSLTPSTGYPRITFAYNALGNQAIT